MRTTALEKTQCVLHEPCQVSCFFYPKTKRVYRGLLLACMGDEQVGGGDGLQNCKHSCPQTTWFIPSINMFWAY